MFYVIKLQFILTNNTDSGLSNSRDMFERSREVDKGSKNVKNMCYGDYELLAEYIH